MSNDPQQAVIIRCAFSGMDGGSLHLLNNLEETLTHIIKSKELGEFDGNEIGQGEIVLYLYGPSAENLYDAVVTTLQSSKLMRSAVITIRRGGPGAPCRVVTLG